MRSYQLFLPSPTLWPLSFFWWLCSFLQVSRISLQRDPSLSQLWVTRFPAIIFQAKVAANLQGIKCSKSEWMAPAEVAPCVITFAVMSHKYFMRLEIWRQPSKSEDLMVGVQMRAGFEDEQAGHRGASAVKMFLLGKRVWRGKTWRVFFKSNLRVKLAVHKILKRKSVSASFFLHFLLSVS